jgi:hypothetical protein
LIECEILIFHIYNEIEAAKTLALFKGEGRVRVLIFLSP